MPRKKRTAPGKKPAGCYLRGATWWGRVEIDGSEHRESLRSTDPEEAGKRGKDWVAKLRADAYWAKVPASEAPPATSAQLTEASAVTASEPDDPNAPPPLPPGSPPPGGPTWMEAVLKWEDEVLDGYKPSVRKRYLVSIGQLDPVFGHLTQNQITSERVGAWVSWRKRTMRSTRTGVGKGRARVSNATIRRDLTALSRLLSACCGWGWRLDNPALAYDRTLIRESRDPAPPAQPASLAAFLAACPPAMASIIRLLDNTGMRMNEADQMERWQVNEGRITLSKTKTSRPRTLAFKTPGGDAAAALAEGARSRFLYRADNGEPYANFSSNFSQVMRRVVKQEEEAGRDFRRFSVKDLRSTFAVRWLRSSGNLHSLSKHLGHSSVKVTEKSYLDWLTVEEQERVQAEALRLMAAA